VSVTARLQLAGFASTREADLNDEIGSGSTPRNGAGSIATVAADLTARKLRRRERPLPVAAQTRCSRRETTLARR
jgi:hypothetical protein